MSSYSVHLYVENRLLKDREEARLLREKDHEHFVRVHGSTADKMEQALKDSARRRQERACVHGDEAGKCDKCYKIWAKENGRV